ncbi:centrosomal protein 248 kDa [Heterostelium album PN500]|uniref:Centrosomal protein 248 kDa n=1 Tax=Heterostelium pallidum (strain ATCC 26659 / Pp 5 / PN500) TaxID=670386 RepID=D3BAY6_HETP5|nr:centrosomal protein 248 kDa [Heterostelium album PN500]EFA81723.1 centrosomal protein 248 kDa [Heterostelium album PN500]|eukprot:XP_020433840.1 centrosomal protein 248 kDa [Heterostelium album PN500]
MTENRAEFDFKIFTGVTLFDDIPDSDFDNVNAKRSSVDSANEAGDSVDESNLSASDKAKNWFHEHYMSLLSYHQQRATRVTEFYVELNDTTASPMSREEKKTMEIEFYQKETTYLRMKRKTKQEEFEPLFKFTQPNGAIIMPVTPAPNKKQQHQQQQQQQQESTATSKSPLSASYPTTPNHNTGSTGNLRSLLIGNNRSPFNSNENLTGTVRFDTKNVRFADTDCIPTSPPSNDEFDRSQVRRTKNLIKNEELLMATPKMANLRVIQDAKLLLRELENEVKGNLECSLINSLIKFLERDTTSDSQAQLQQVAALTLNESFESNTDQEVADPKSALYMRIENDSNTIDELGSQVEALKKMITNLEFDLGEAKMLNSKLEEDIDLLKTPQPHHMSMADELRSAFQQDDTSKEKLRDEYDSQILQLNQENLQYALEIESLRQQLLNQEESAKKLRAQLELELARQTAELNKTIELKSNEIDELVRQKEIALDEHSRLINEKQQSIEQLTVDVQSKVVDIQKLDGQVKELENSLSQTNQILIDKEMAIDRFINEVEQKDKQLQERDEQLHESMCEIRNRDEQLQDLSNRINEKDSLIKENTVIIDKLNESVSENQLVIEQLGQKNKQNEDLVKRLELDNEEKQSALEKLVVDVKEKDVQINGLSESVQEKDRLSQRLTEEVEKKAEHLQKLSAENEEKQLLIEKITTENQVKQDSIVQLTEENANGVKEIKRLEQELDSLKLELSNGASANDADKTLIQQLRKEKAQLLGEHIISINALNSKLTHLYKRDKESLESQKSADTLRITQLDQQLAQLQEQHQQFTEKINNSLQLNKTSLVSYDEYTNQQMNRIQQSLDINVNSRLNTLEQSVKETTEHNQHLHTQIQQLTKVNSEQSEMIATTLEKVNGLQQTNNELVEKNVHLQRKSDELFVDLEREKENASSLSTENAHLKEQIADLIKKLEAKSHKHGLAVKELSQQLFDMTELVKKTTEKEEVEMIALPDPQLVKDYSIVEESPLIRFINEKLPMTDEIKHVFPVDSSKHVKLAIYDGVLMCKLVNLAREGTIDERVMNMKPQNRIEVDQNFNLVCNSSRAIGCVIQNITPQAVQQDPHITLSLIYQLVRVYINSSINLNNYPNLLVFKSSDEDIKHFAAQSSSQLLLRWACYHLEIKKSKESVEQLLLKPLNCIKLLCKLDKELVPPSSSSSNEDESVLYEWILTETSNRFKIFPWLTLDTMKSKNEKLAYLFIASLFLSEKGIGITIEENETKEVTLLVKEVSDLVDVEGTREERAFCMWINSLNLSPYVNNLQQDLQDGLIILQMFDKIKPGSVNWKNVNQHPSNNYMEMENCNLGIDLARKLKFSLVGVGGRDIHEGNRKLTLALIWQACKYHLLSILASLRPVSSSGGNLSSSSKDVGESDIIRWANQKVTTIGKSTGIHGFKDGSVGNGLFLIDLLESMSRGCINYSIVTPGDTDENKKLNAQYIINVARKLDCCIFLVWEDIVEVKPKMILTLVAQLYIKSVIDV